jgi:hypothetical protein
MQSDCSTILAGGASPRLTPSINLLDWALGYAETFNIPVGPLYPLSVDGSCTCPKRAGCTHPGKHPISHDPITGAAVCPRGALGYTTDTATITAWWTAYPNAGIGGDLARANLVDISSDSFAWLYEFERRGLPPTAAFQSSLAGHYHYFYRRPDDCPVTRICKSGEYDILSNGNVVLPPTPYAPGQHRAWLSDDINLNGGLSNPPAWAVDMLKETAAKHDIPPSAAFTGTGADRTDAPPVRLSEWAVEVWEGKHPARKPDGSIDRSDSLWAIGMELARANASAPAIAAALAERDVSLSWRCYADRTDATHQYATIAARVIAEVEAEHEADTTSAEPAHRGAPTPTDHRRCLERLNRERGKRLKLIRRFRPITRERNKLVRVNTHLRAYQTKVMLVLGNEHMSAQERITGIITANTVAAGISRGLDRDGFVKVCLDEPEPQPPAPEPADAGWRESGRRRRGSDYSIRRRSGCSAATASRAVNRLVARGVFDSYGEKDERSKRRRIFLSLTPETPAAGADDALLGALDRMAACRPAEGTPKRNGHGGAPLRCPDHPTAAIVVKRYCDECGLELASIIEGAKTDQTDQTDQNEGFGGAAGDGCDAKGQTTPPGVVVETDHFGGLGIRSLKGDHFDGFCADGVDRPPQTRWRYQGVDITHLDAAAAAAAGDG